MAQVFKPNDGGTTAVTVKPGELQTVRIAPGDFPAWNNPGESCAMIVPQGALRIAGRVTKSKGAYYAEFELTPADSLLLARASYVVVGTNGGSKPVQLARGELYTEA